MLTRDTAITAWGPRLLPSGQAEFRIWAPDRQRMNVVVADRQVQMERQGDGWFSAVVPADAGCLYQFALDDGTRLADPASRAQAHDLEGPSILTDQNRFPWQQGEWRGRPWSEAVIYELHVGTFTDEGTFKAAIPRLGELARAGITALEIMPVAQFPGNRGWGYDGVLHFAPHIAYGTPEDLKALVDAAHGHGMMILLDVVYNHFGPLGNALPRYASRFFNRRRSTPWGPAVEFNEPAVRQYFIENALYWLRDFRFDGLRLDAIGHIKDRQDPTFLHELAATVGAAFPDRHVHLVVEDEERRRDLVAYSPDAIPLHFSANWNDDLHHALHVIATGEANGHYTAYAEDPWTILKDVLACGFHPCSAAEKGKRPVMPPARVAFLQNHDQVGNRALGERLRTLVGADLTEVMTALLLLSPQIPLLFMGDDYGETRPFHFFADYQGEIADAIRKSRPEEAANFGGRAEDVDHMPDPIDVQTFASSKLDWKRAEGEGGRRERERLRTLIELRMRHVVPFVAPPEAVLVHPTPDGVVAIDWRFPGAKLQLRLNLSDAEQRVPGTEGHVIWSAGWVPDETTLRAPGILVATHEVSAVSRRGDTGTGRRQ
ncbi:malto-oligosyltrehalose trehalohydrolase [Sinorhizobium kostiense]|uniref:malto-oligosyltrehalose trehalohydrolase n=1 Tax=Sinorhizobium kostiense TaxID=76747 RepID=UPI0022864365|nr:malto-oligosyltrehalose trehalohydrolase [Sinorhizobium kostiense]